MEFRDLKKQYQILKSEIDTAMEEVLNEGNFISGRQVQDLEQQLAEYVGVKHCITCANGTDALTLALMAWGIGPGDAVFVPDFTFFASGETVASVGATPVFVDVYENTFNLSVESLEEVVKAVVAEGKLLPKAVVTVDLFGLPADYNQIIPIAKRYGLKILEDGAQGFGGELDGKKACSFGNISTTSFFPAKPLGCYGDGGAIFTDDDSAADLIRSFCVHGKGTDKYDNVRLGMNSRLDTLQAAVLKVKLNVFVDYELREVNCVAARYSELLGGIVKTPYVPAGFMSSWAQYSILMKDKEERDGLQASLKEQGIPSMIYYRKPMHIQSAFENEKCIYASLKVTEDICNRVLSLPIHPYLHEEEIMQISDVVRKCRRYSQ